MKQRNQEIITSPRDGQSCLHVKHETGLDIYIMEMPDFHSAFALFGTKYGSVNTMFRLDGEKDFAQVPEGIAHFLEHKLFENEDTGAFEQYAETGAIANAYTSFDRTAYLFMCSENFNPSLEILLNFVQHPYFTQETVDKEQGIIAQEIRMIEDNPDWQIYHRMVQAMYSASPKSWKCCVNSRKPSRLSPLNILFSSVASWQRCSRAQTPAAAHHHATPPCSAAPFPMIAESQARV